MVRQWMKSHGLTYSTSPCICYTSVFPFGSLTVCCHQQQHFGLAGIRKRGSRGILKHHYPHYPWDLFAWPVQMVNHILFWYIKLIISLEANSLLVVVLCGSAVVLTYQFLCAYQSSTWEKYSISYQYKWQWFSNCCLKGIDCGS